MTKTIFTSEEVPQLLESIDKILNSAHPSNKDKNECELKNYFHVKLKKIQDDQLIFIAKVNEYDSCMDVELIYYPKNEQNPPPCVTPVQYNDIHLEYGQTDDEIQEELNSILICLLADNQRSLRRMQCYLVYNTLVNLIREASNLKFLISLKSYFKNKNNDMFHIHCFTTNPIEKQSVNTIFVFKLKDPICRETFKFYLLEQEEEEDEIE